MLQIAEATDREKFEMYNKLDKYVLIGMLIECNKQLSRITPTISRSEMKDKGIKHYKDITKNFKTDIKYLDDYDKYKYLKKQISNVFWQGFYVNEKAEFKLIYNDNR